jgi:hypothetical protein
MISLALVAGIMKMKIEIDKRNIYIREHCVNGLCNSAETVVEINMNKTIDIK